MSLFQCENCGVRENTALSNQGCQRSRMYDWGGKEGLKGKLLCSMCGPVKFRDGGKTGFGEWHGAFEKKFYALGTMKTDDQGNLVPKSN